MRDEETKEDMLRGVLAEIAAQSRELLEELKGADLATLRDRLSPDGNGASCLISRLNRALRRFGRGEMPAVWLTEWQSDAMRLLDELKRQYPEVRTLHQTWNAQFSFYALLTESYEEYDDDESYWGEIVRKLEVLRNMYRENSNGFNELLVESRRAAAAQGAVPRGARARTKDPEVARRRREKEEMLRIICRKYAEAAKKGRCISYLRLVTEMMRPGMTYSARMRGAKAKTWADQASAFGKFRFAEFEVES